MSDEIKYLAREERRNLKSSHWSYWYGMLTLELSHCLFEILLTVSNWYNWVNFWLAAHYSVKSIIRGDWFIQGFGLDKNEKATLRMPVRKIPLYPHEKSILSTFNNLLNSSMSCYTDVIRQ